MKLRNNNNCCEGKKISLLSEKLNLKGTEYIPYQEGDSNGKISIALLLEYLVSILKEYLLENNIIREDWVQSEPAFKLLATLPELIADRACKDEFGNNINDTYITRDSVKNYIQEVFDDLFIDNPPTILDGFITVDMLSDAVLELLNSGGAVTNFPDDEDLTVKDGKLKLKDKVYDPNNYSGLGRTILRKNMVDGVNVLTLEMVSQPNVIYYILYDYDLQGETVNILDNCILKFEGGSISNGTITCKDTLIVIPYQKDIEDILDGTYIFFGASNGGSVTPSDIEVIDNLTSSDAEAALSANQGRVLKELIDNIDIEDLGNLDLLTQDIETNTTNITNLTTTVNNLKDRVDSISISAILLLKITQSEYNSLNPKDPNTIYLITD